jgi:hypothetical protein
MRYRWAGNRTVTFHVKSVSGNPSHDPNTAPPPQLLSADTHNTILGSILMTDLHFGLYPLEKSGFSVGRSTVYI